MSTVFAFEMTRTSVLKVKSNLRFYRVIETADRHVFQSNGLTHASAFRKI